MPKTIAYIPASTDKQDSLDHDGIHVLVEVKVA